MTSKTLLATAINYKMLSKIKKRTTPEFFFFLNASIKNTLFIPNCKIWILIVTLSLLRSKFTPNPHI